MIRGKENKVNKDKSIKKRLVISYISIIGVAIVILDILLLIVIKAYYYDNSEKLLRNQMGTAIAFYNKYFTSSSLEENIYDNVDSFWNETDAEVQIYDSNGTLIMDSIGVNDVEEHYVDVEKALSGEEFSRWIGSVSYDDDNVMAVSSPIVNDDEIIGVLRYIISLDNVDNQIRLLITSFIVISIVVFVVGTFVSIIIAKSIINPITGLTKVANDMAGGNLTVRSEIKDNDEVGKLAATLNYMAEELEKRDKLKDEFISSVSHELRTPLTAIKGWVITIEDDETDRDTLKTGLKIIEKETDRLGEMVEELLDFSRLQNGSVKINLKDINIIEFIKYMEVYLSKRGKRENKNFNVIYDLKSNIIYMDPDKMKQVIINLIDNSFKFTQEDGNINLKFIDNEKELDIIVEDNGCGISQEDLPRVKEKFYKGKNAKSQNGIGLSICDEIIKLHGGKFIIESEEGKGTKIKVSIPIGRRE